MSVHVAECAKMEMWSNMVELEDEYVRGNL